MLQTKPDGIPGNLFSGDTGLLWRAMRQHARRLTEVLISGCGEWAGPAFVLDMMNINASEPLNDLADETIGDMFAQGFGLSVQDYAALKPDIDCYTTLHLMRHIAWITTQADDWTEKASQRKNV